MSRGPTIRNSGRLPVTRSTAGCDGFTFVQYSAFRRRSPKLDSTITFALVPSLTDAGRVRGELNVSISVEVIHNFFVGLSGFDTFDSGPPDTSLTKNDYGVTPSLRWKF